MGNKMNCKKDWIERLKESLKKLGISKSQTEEIASEFEQHFADADESLTEKEVCEKLGDPEEIAGGYAEDAPEKPPKKLIGKKRSGLSVGAIIGTLCADIFVLSWLLPSLAAVLASLWVVIATCILGGIVGAIPVTIGALGISMGISDLTQYASFSQFMGAIFFLIGIAFIGALLVYPMIKLTELMVKLCVWIINYHIRVFGGKKKIKMPAWKMKFFNKIWHIVTGGGAILACVIAIGFFSVTWLDNDTNIVETVQTEIGDVRSVAVESSGNVNIMKTSGAAYCVVYFPENIQPDFDYSPSEKRLEITDPTMNDRHFGIISLPLDFLNFSIFGVDRDYYAVDVYLPEKQYDKFDLVSGGGSVNSELSAKNIDVDTVSGSIYLENVNSNVLNVDTVSGGIFLVGHASTTDISTVSGEIAMEDYALKGGDVNIDTVSGGADLNLATNAGINAKIDTISGEISFERELRNEYRSGRGNLFVSGEPMFDITFSSVSGRLFVWDVLYQDGDDYGDDYWEDEDVFDNDYD